MYAAFFWAMINGYVLLCDEGSDSKVYKLRSIILGMEDDSLIVSNGTACDQLYEVLDAIAIYPELIKKILEDVDRLSENDVNNNSQLEDGILFSALKSFSISKPGLGKKNSPAKSIFDLPMLMKKSATPDIYYEANVIEMLGVEIDEIIRYISRFCSEKELPEIAGKLIMEQFDKHLESLGIEYEENPAIYRESLFEKVCDTITNSLKNLGLIEEASKIQQSVKDLRQ